MGGRAPEELGGWDHVVEASLDVRSGRVVLGSVEGPADPEPLAVDPGCYGVRSAARGLAGADELEGGDRYLVQLWPGTAREPEV